MAGWGFPGTAPLQVWAETISCKKPVKKIAIFLCGILQNSGSGLSHGIANCRGRATR